MKKQHCLRLAYDIASSDNHTFLSAYINVGQADKLHNTRRCTGKEIEVSYHDFTYVYRVECIHILVRKNRKENLLTVNSLGERKLYQYAVNFLFIIKRVNKL